MLSLFLLILLIAVVLGFLGVILKGLLYLTAIGAALFVAGLVTASVRRARRRGRRPPYP